VQRMLILKTQAIQCHMRGLFGIKNATTQGYIG